MLLIIFIIIIVCIISIANNSGKTNQILNNSYRQSNFNKLYDYSTPFNLGEVRLAQGRRQEALDCYTEALYKINLFIDYLETDKSNTNFFGKSKGVPNREINNKRIIEDKIRSVRCNLLS